MCFFIFVFFLIMYLFCIPDEFINLRVKRTLLSVFLGDRRGHDHMVVGFTTTCAIRAYHH